MTPQEVREDVDRQVVEYDIDRPGALDNVADMLGITFAQASQMYDDGR